MGIKGPSLIRKTDGGPLDAARGDEGLRRRNVFLYVCSSLSCRPKYKRHKKKSEKSALINEIHNPCGKMWTLAGCWAQKQRNSIHNVDRSDSTKGRVSKIKRREFLFLLLFSISRVLLKMDVLSLTGSANDNGAERHSVPHQQGYGSLCALFEGRLKIKDLKRLVYSQYRASNFLFIYFRSSFLCG